MAVVEKEVRKMKNPKTCKLHDEKRETWKGKTAADESSDESSVTTQWWVEREREREELMARTGLQFKND